MSRAEPGQVRAEDRFDIAAVHEWLAARVDGISGSALPEVRQFPGGASHLTYLLAYSHRDLILRRPPEGEKAASAHDMRREYRVQAGLEPVFPYVPRMLAFCDDHTVLGDDFYVMERIDGLILRGNLPDGTTLDPAQTLGMSTGLIDRLVELHEVDVEARICLIHNDYRFDNVLLDGADAPEIVGILDWEMAPLGDPLMELATTLSYWVQADDEMFQASRRQPTHLPGMLTRAEVVDHYAARTGMAIPSWIFYEVYGLFRLAVVLQQIYYRYHHGQTHNPAFKDFWMFVGYLESRCRRVIEEGGV